MKQHQLLDTKTGHIIFAAKSRSIKQLVETAVEQNLSLAGCDLRGADLTNAQLDGGDFQNANLQGANLRGTNLSEVDLSDADLRDTNMCDACLCDSVLRGADLRYARFGGALWAGADLSSALVAGSSALELPWQELGNWRGIRFETESEQLRIIITKPPLVIKGLDMKIIMLPNIMMIGRTLFAIHDRSGTPFIKHPDHESAQALTFYKSHAPLIETLLQEIRKNEPQRLRKSA